MQIRLLDLGTVPYLRSQTVYHAVARAMTARSPDTIILVSPDKPYLCLGCHQELDKEVNVEYCRQHDIPVLRREVGGGAVYLDGNQMFIHWVFHRERLPKKMEDIYALFIQAPVATYRAIGVNASYRPVNDIVVGPRKIGGTGIVSIGNAMVVVGSIMFDFDCETMPMALKVSSEKMRDKVIQSLRDYMTSIKRELGDKAPSRDEVKAVLIENSEKILDITPERGSLSSGEEKVAQQLDKRFLSQRWTNRKSGMARKGITVSGAMRVVEADYKAPGGLIRVTLCVDRDIIKDVSISGDFTFYPSGHLSKLERWLVGQRLDEKDLSATIGEFYSANGVQSPGMLPVDLAKALIVANGG